MLNNQYYECNKKIFCDENFFKKILKLIKEEIVKDEDKEKKKEEELKAQKEKEKEEAHKKLMEEYKQREKKLNKITVTFTNKDYFRSIFATMNKKPTKDKKEKICIITGKPAKYFDPLTKNYYSTIEAFKILRERYFQKEEEKMK